MKIHIICVGKLKEKYFADGVLEYSKRLSAYAKLTITEVSDEKTKENLSKAEEKIIKEKEGERILGKINARDFVIALDILGKQLASEEFSAFLQTQMVQGNSDIVFVIGGSIGLDERVLERANYRLSFSKMTFPHQLMRVILLEQIYRGYKIIEGAPYHK